MRVRELVGILGIKEIAPVHFFTDLSKNNIRCMQMTDEETEDYDNKVLLNKKKYDNSKLGIYLPDITTDELNKLEREEIP